MILKLVSGTFLRYWSHYHNIKATQELAQMTPLLNISLCMSPMPGGGKGADKIVNMSKRAENCPLT